MPPRVGSTYPEENIRSSLWEGLTRSRKQLKTCTWDKGFPSNAKTGFVTKFYRLASGKHIGFKNLGRIVEV